MSLNFPVLWPFGITLMWIGSSCELSWKDPSMRPRLHSLCRYSEMTCGCRFADPMLDEAAFNGEPCWNPALKPQHNPW